MENEFAGRVAIVTGGSFGIGRAASVALVRRGAKVIIVDNFEDAETLNLV